MGLQRWPIIATYWYTNPSQYCPWFHNTSQRQFPVNPDVFQHGTHWEHCCTWWSWLWNLYQIAATCTICQKPFQASLYNTSTAQWEPSSRHKESHTVASVLNLRTKEPSLLGHQAVDSVWFSKELLLGIFWVQTIETYWTLGCHP
jgi:hypothetical protein